jgi:hypothetical protein
LTSTSCSGAWISFRPPSSRSALIILRARVSSWNWLVLYSERWLQFRRQVARDVALLSYDSAIGQKKLLEIYVTLHWKLLANMNHGNHIGCSVSCKNGSNFVPSVWQRKICIHRQIKAILDLQQALLPAHHPSLKKHETLMIL